MIEREACNGSLKNVLNCDSFIVSYLTKHIAEVKRNGSRKVNLQILVVVVLHHVVLIELSKAVIDQLVTVRFLQMLKDKFGEACQKCARPLLLVYLLKKLFPGKGVAFTKLATQILGHHLPKIVDEKLAADIGARSLVSKYPAQVSNVVDDLGAVVQAGVRTRPHNTGDAGLMSTQGPCRCQEIPSNLDVRPRKK